MQLNYKHLYSTYIQTLKTENGSVPAQSKCSMKIYGIKSTLKIQIQRKNGNIAVASHLFLPYNELSRKENL